MRTYENCILSLDPQQVTLEGGEIVEVYDVRERASTRKYYVSFYYGWEGYKYWANWVTPGQPFTAKKSRRNRFHVGGHGASQQIRMDKAIRANVRITRRNGKPMY